MVVTVKWSWCGSSCVGGVGMWGCGGSRVVRKTINNRSSEQCR